MCVLIKVALGLLILSGAIRFDLFDWQCFGSVQAFVDKHSEPFIANRHGRAPKMAGIAGQTQLA